MDLDQMLEQWNVATGNLPYGVQRVFHDVLTLTEQGKKKNLVWGADYSGDAACLVNSSGGMLTSGEGHGVPTANFGEVVGLYDRINRELRSREVNTDNLVSPLAAEILLRNFAPLKEPKATPPTRDAIEAFAENVPYHEPTDDELATSLMSLLEGEAPAVEIDVPFDADEVINASVQDQ